MRIWEILREDNVTGDLENDIADLIVTAKATGREKLPINSAIGSIKNDPSGKLYGHLDISGASIRNVADELTGAVTNTGGGDITLVPNTEETDTPNSYEKDEKTVKKTAAKEAGKSISNKG